MENKPYLSKISIFICHLKEFKLKFQFQFNFRFFIYENLLIKNK